MRITNDEEGWELIIDTEAMKAYNDSLTAWSGLVIE
jgi:hypothetical protein